MSRTPAQSPAALQWPAERFYWVILDRKLAVSASPTLTDLQEFIQDDVPCSASDLALTATALSSDQLLVCGIPQKSLADLPSHIIHCGPASFPEWLVSSHSGDLPHLSEINFLTGPFTPALIRRHQRNRALWLSGMTLAATLFLALGLHRRTSHFESLASQHQQHIETLASQTLGMPVISTRAAEFLQARLDRAETLQRAATQTSVDMGMVIAQFLDAWPSDLAESPRVEILSASRDQLALSVTTSGDSQDLIARLKPPAGWKLLEPRLSARGTSTQIQLECRPAKAGAS